MENNLYEFRNYGAVFDFLDCIKDLIIWNRWSSMNWNSPETHEYLSSGENLNCEKITSFPKIPRILVLIMIQNSL